MRMLSVLPLAFVVWRLGGVLGDDDAEAGMGSDDDLDLEDDFEDNDPSPNPGPMGGAPEVEDFDLGMDETDKSNRMGSCFSYTMGRLQVRRDMMQKHAQEMMEQHGVKQNQAMTAVISSWMMACYMNIEEDQVTQAIGTPFGQPIAVSKEREDGMFAHHPAAKQTAQQASRKQWSLLETTLNENSKNMPQGPGADQKSRPGGPQAEPLGMHMDSGTGFIYMMAVFVVLFGLGAIVVMRLSQKEQGNDKDRGSKSQRKAEKAERQAAKKRM